MILSLKTHTLPIVRFIGEIAYHQPWIHFPRIANEYIIYIIKKGTMYIEEDNILYTLKKKDFFIFEPDKAHKGTQASPCEYFYIHFSHPHIQPLSPSSEATLAKEFQLRRTIAMTSNCLDRNLPSDATCFIPKHFSLAHLDYYATLLKEGIHNYDNRQENYKEIISCELLNLLIRISRELASTRIEEATTQLNKPLHKAQDILSYLNKEYAVKMTSEELADLFDSNFDYLNRCFKQLTGYTIFTYLNMIRISKAKELIFTTHMKFGEIGYLVGVDNPYYFSRLFKQHAGCTPTEFYHQNFKPTP